MERFLSSNETKYRLLRTIAQGVIGVLIANVDLLISGLHFEPEVKALIVALIMAILSPIMSEMGISARAEQDTFNEEAFLDMVEGGEDEEDLSEVEPGDEEGEEDEDTDNAAKE